MTYDVLAFYHFHSLDPNQLHQLREQLREAARSSQVRGLMILGSEGVNATLSGGGQGLGQFMEKLVQIVGLNAPIEGKRSVCEKHPFRHFKCKIRPEIVTTHDLSLHPREGVGTYLSPAAWRTLSADPNAVVVDTRNWYETAIGKFRGAVDLHLKQFTEFGKKAQEIPKDKKVMLYCTGGIRCEKAVVEMKRLGYEQVYQLEGGILNFLKEFPHTDFEGECFVFDYRVAVDQGLNPSAKYRLCPHCGQPGALTITCDQCQTPAVICEDCAGKEHRHTCSKNCAHHHRLGHRCRKPFKSARQSRLEKQSLMS